MKRAEGREDILQLWDALMTLEVLVSNDLEVRAKLTPVRPHSHNVRGSLFCHCSPGEQLIPKERDTALTLRKMFCPHLILSLLRVGEGEIRPCTSIPYKFLFLRNVLTCL